MANSPNMNLPIPTVGVTQGPDWANDLDASLTLIDGHSHSSGSGVQITPSGLNINAPLSLQNNSLISIGALTLQAQLSTPTNLSLYGSGVDLYFVDGSGNPIQITKSGGVSGTPGSIANLTPPASASYASSTFTFQSAVNTAASLDGQNLILRLSSANSNALTLSAPSSLSGGSYQLFLPTIPSGISVMSLDASGNMGTLSDGEVATLVSGTGEVSNLAKNAQSGGQYVVVSDFNAASQMKIVRGNTNGSGAVNGEGFTIVHTSTGGYGINFAAPFNGQPSVVASGGYGTIVAVDNNSATGSSVGITVFSSNGSSTPVDGQFSFIAIGLVV